VAVCRRQLRHEFSNDVLIRQMISAIEQANGRSIYTDSGLHSERV
jgi:hypothetical protein